jgi:thiamine-phosphate pyrophosphorylase
MCKRICITNRHLVKEDFLERIELLAASDVDAIILREKDLPEEEYKKLAERVLNICRKYGKDCILHTYYKAAEQLGCDKIHLPMEQLKNMPERDKAYFNIIGASAHSVEDAACARALGADYITASHIYPTSCKPGLPARGLDFLKSVVRAVDIPVYALGGINEERISDCIAAGAKGVCMMSEYMKLPKEILYSNNFEKMS